MSRNSISGWRMIRPERDENCGAVSSIKVLVAGIVMLSNDAVGIPRSLVLSSIFVSLNGKTCKRSH